MESFGLLFAYDLAKVDSVSGALRYSFLIWQFFVFPALAGTLNMLTFPKFIISSTSGQ